MPRIVDKAAMQDRIIAAAMAAFLKHGYGAAKMSDIAVEAGLAKGTLYLYFPTKDALTLGLVRACFARWEQQLQASAAPQTLAAFVAALRAAITPDAADRQATRMFFEILAAGAKLPGLLDEAAAFYRVLGRVYTQQLLALQACGAIAPGLNAPAHGRAIASMADGLVIHRALFEVDDAQYHDMVDAVIAQVLAGLQQGAGDD